MRNCFKTTLIFFLLTISQMVNAAAILIEAESFKNKGGWVTDQQFVFQMGSPYLLAHGMGKPVADATTEIELSKTGSYHVWVRTMNWAPGNWEAPGRFRLIVNKQEMKTDLGVNAGWKWQYAGKVNIRKKTVTLELKDLTGFEGRCDAIYFSTKKETPPDELKSLEIWRKQQKCSEKEKVKLQKFDLVVVGGGTAGCAAAIAAAEKGLNVALIHDRPVLGGNASGEVRVHTLGQYGFFERIIQKIETEHHPNGSAKLLADDEKRMNNMRAYDNIHLFLSWQAVDAKAENNSIKYVEASHIETGEILRFEAPVFADCTGDAWIGYWAGAEYMYGRESKHQFGEEELSSKGFNFDFNKSLKEQWTTNKDIIWSPEKPDQRVMGSSVLWNSALKDYPSTFPEVPWAMEVAKGHKAIKGEWYWEYSSNDLSQIDDAEAIRDHMFKAIYGSFYNAKRLPENGKVVLAWVSYLLGKRESRRLTGDYIYTFNDVRNDTKFDDAVVFESRSVDVHHQQVLVNSSRPDFLSDAIYYKKTYSIPYRSLYSKNIKNLFMAGRNFSCSHLGLGGPRVMNTTAQMGCVVGYAASLCVENEVLPRDIYQNYLPQLMELIKSSDDEKVMIEERK